MKIGKGTELLKKAASTCKNKIRTGVVMARLRILTSPHRRMATIGAISHRIHTLIVENQEKGAKVDYHKTLVRKVERQACHGMVDDLFHHLAQFDEDDGVGGCPNWTLHPIFSDGDNCCYTYGYDDNDDDEDEPSVVDPIRSNQEAAELAFNMDDDIDQAA
ncbi:uncharacterized protein LOC119297622 [Triticum dicoccoides]|uniref:uncharacterized protein LOC119297622 n=1 Tax=Triticum dicoccoides TaxID=85692 RepID=UPI00188DF5D8|nr:uncharacterized protein LOC119297622 [Triticum dicoccoides]